jgi:hypothetical protein
MTKLNSEKQKNSSFLKFGKIDSWAQFHQCSTHSFCTGSGLMPVKYKPKT